LRSVVDEQPDISNQFLARLAKLAAINAKPPELVEILAATLTKPTLADRLMVALDDGLRTRGSSVPQATEQSDGKSRQALEVFFANALKTLTDQNADSRLRAVATTRLAFANNKQAQQLGALLDPAHPVEVQRAAIEAIGRRAAADGANRLLEGWPSYSPDMRRLAADKILGRTKWTLLMLDAIEGGNISAGDIALDRQQLLLNHPVTSIRAKARAVLGKPTSTRQAVVDRYRPALEIAGDPKAGFIVFKKACVNCHRAGETGFAVGPDLQSVQNKTAEDLLVSILDPNRDVQPNYYVYGALTQRGKVINGIIVNDSTNSITLRAAEAKEQTVLRKNLESLASTRVSLMPEGVEKDLTIKQSADLISFIKSLRPASKQ
jgi:putative heme-binding domain-containing protein